LIKKVTKNYSWFVIVFCIHESLISLPKIQNLKTTSKLCFIAKPFAFQAQLADCCHFTFLCFLCFLFKGGRGVLKVTFAIASTILYLESNLFFCLDAKETKDQA
jgi:hypothetical protein